MSDPNELQTDILMDYFTFAKDIFMNDRVIASRPTLQALEPIIVQFLEHPALNQHNLAEMAELIECLQVLGFATFHIPVITAEFWDAFRVVFDAFARAEVPEGIY